MLKVEGGVDIDRIDKLGVASRLSLPNRQVSETTPLAKNLSYNLVEMFFCSIGPWILIIPTIANSGKVVDRKYAVQPPQKSSKNPKTDCIQRIFLNHSIKKWSDITLSFILNDNNICFIAFLDVCNTNFVLQKMVTKKTQNFRSPGPPPSF